MNFDTEEGTGMVGTGTLEGAVEAKPEKVTKKTTKKATKKATKKTAKKKTAKKKTLKKSGEKRHYTLHHAAKSKSGKYMNIRHATEAAFKKFGGEAPTDKIIEFVKAEFPKSAFKGAHVAFYRNQIVTNNQWKYDNFKVPTKCATAPKAKTKKKSSKK